jgi:nucleoid DNA-binding protein
MTRNELIDFVEQQTGISLHEPETERALIVAFEYMERMTAAKPA